MTSRARNLYLVPYLLWIGLFVIAPIALIVYYSLFDVEGQFTLSNYVKFFYARLFENDTQLVLVRVPDYVLVPADCISNGIFDYEDEA